MRQSLMTPEVKAHPYWQTIAKRFRGKLSSGKHKPDGMACALEAATVARGKRWSDGPRAAGLPDLRHLNDWSGWEDNDAARTRALVPLVVALWDWAYWSPEAKRSFQRRVVARLRERWPEAHIDGPWLEVIRRRANAQKKMTFRWTTITDWSAARAVMVECLAIATEEANLT